MLRAQSGLSLLELVLGLSLSSLLLLSSSTLFVHQQQLLSQQIKRTQLLIASHHLATYLRGEVRRAGYAQSSGIEIQGAKISLGYKDEAGEYRRVSIWRDALQTNSSIALALTGPNYPCSIPVLTPSTFRC
ncbi:hypothetical protein [Vibrio breoganii]|uniref:hypothetical protein n=1 Tax=Vibrio breoganii TaxID=553239 RepID=UPI0021C3D8AC|nr:hypothetical protein [Vibrio breoganii]MDN3717029.1 hypothetical protein [Vibrio breoganii]